MNKIFLNNCSKIHRIILLGNFGPPFLACARSWAAQGIDVFLLEPRKGQSRWMKYSSYLAGGRNIDHDALFKPEGLEFIKNYVDMIQAEALISLDDKNLIWLACNRDLFEPVCKVLVPPLAALELFSSKQEQIELAGSVGFVILPSWYLYSTEDWCKVPLENFPVCLRPADLLTVKESFKVKVIYSPLELRTFIDKLTFLGHPIIVQPFYHLPNLVVHGIRSERGEVVLEAFLVTRKFEGVSLSIQRTELQPKLAENCAIFLKNSGIIGCFHFELLYRIQDCKSYFLEINTRLGGTTEKVLRLGFDEPGLLLNAFGFCGNRKSCYGISKHHRVVNKKAIIKHILYAIKGKITEIDYPPANRISHILKSLYELVFIRDSVFDWNDIRGSIWFYFRI